MGKKAQLVMGPAGSGKSTYCTALAEHCEEIHRAVHVINLDPAAETFNYEVSVDIRDMINVDEVMEEMQYGPNGGLVFCMEYLMENIEWLQEQIGDFADDYLIIDCPGQIELYMHIPVMRTLVGHLQDWGYAICGLYLLDSQFVDQPDKFISGALMCLSCMLQLEIPHINVLTKMDILKRHLPRGKDLTEIFDVDMTTIIDDLNENTPPQFRALNAAMGSMLESFSLVSFVPLDISEPETISTLLAMVDNAIQYDDDLEPKGPRGGDEADDSTLNDLVIGEQEGGD